MPGHPRRRNPGVASRPLLTDAAGSGACAPFTQPRLDGRADGSDTDSRPAGGRSAPRAPPRDLRSGGAVPRWVHGASPTGQGQGADRHRRSVGSAGLQSPGLGPRTESHLTPGAADAHGGRGAAMRYRLVLALLLLAAPATGYALDCTPNTLSVGQVTVIPRSI